MHGLKRQERISAAYQIKPSVSMYDSRSLPCTLKTAFVIWTATLFVTGLGRGAAVGPKLADPIQENHRSLSQPVPSPSRSGQETAAKVKPPSIPKREQVEAIAQQQFKKLNRQANDMISQGDVKPIFLELEKAGWKVADQEEILKLVLRDGDPLVKQLRTTAGKQAIRGLGGLQGVYDRLDRMVSLPDGERFLRDILAWPDSAQMVRTITTTDQGADLAASLNNAPRPKDFTKPTGRLYTPAAFTARLLASHAEAAKKPAKGK